MKAVAMYLPQFHEVEENNRWWGKGFTDWKAVKQADKLFESHRQPRLPLNANYYDLSEKATMMWQAGLMKQYGIDGLCIYHYWFKDGKKILEKPAENLLEWKDVDIPFCFSWANETWARSWSKLAANTWATKFENKGEDLEHAILLLQDYGAEKQWKEHFEYLIPFFKDSRYIKIENKPVFMIYKPSDIICLDKMCSMWNKWAKEEGLSGIYFIAATDEEAENEFISAYYSHQPRKIVEKIHRGINEAVPPLKLDYDVIWRGILTDAMQREHTYFGAFVDFDATPRLGEKGVVVYGAEPEKFKNYLTELMAKNEAYGKDITFINAWNEWGEGMYLEPDEEHGYAYLEAVSYAKEHYKEFVPDYRRKKELNVHGMWERYDMLEEQAKRFVPRARIFDKWLSIKEDGNNLGKYFEEQGIHSVAIYGMGRLGRHLLSDLQQNNVSVEYVIDRRMDIREMTLPVYDMENAPLGIDTVIVALDSEYEKVIWRLEEKGFKNVLLIENVIDEIISGKHNSKKN